MSIVSLKEELRAVLRECDDAIALVKSDAARNALCDCQCNHNRFAKDKYGFAVGYAKSSVTRLLKLMEGG